MTIQGHEIGLLLALLALLAGGFMAGSMGGLMGIGGGVVLMPLLRFVADLPPTRAAGTCVLAVFFTTLGGTWRHHKMGGVNWRSIAPTIISGALATVLFSLLFDYFSGREAWLDLAVGLVLSLISLRMIIEGLPGFARREEDEAPGSAIGGSVSRKASIGFLAGIFPGLLGIGTGAVLVPAFTYALQAPVKAAMASSLACFSINAFISSGFKLGQGYIDLKIALPICLGTLIGSNLGASLNRRFSSAALKLAFGLVFAYASSRFVLSFLEAGM